jgi:hypothetical protein
MTRTLPTPVHVRLTYASCGRSPYVTTFYKPSTALDRPYCYREKALLTQTQLSWVIHRSATQFLSQHNHWSSNESQTYVDSRLLGLLGPYHRHAISTFNTCSRGPTHRSLTDTGEGYNLAGVILPTPLPDLPNRRFYTFHLMAPSDLRLSIQTLPTEKGDKP